MNITDNPYYDIYFLEIYIYIYMTEKLPVKNAAMAWWKSLNTKKEREEHTKIMKEIKEPEKNKDTSKKKNSGGRRTRKRKIRKKKSYIGTKKNRIYKRKTNKKRRKTNRRRKQRRKHKK